MYRNCSSAPIACLRVGSPCFRLGHVCFHRRRAGSSRRPAHDAGEAAGLPSSPTQLHLLPITFRPFPAAGHLRDLSGHRSSAIPFRPVMVACYRSHLRMVHRPQAPAQARRRTTELLEVWPVSNRTNAPNQALQRTGSAVTAPAADHHRLCFATLTPAGQPSAGCLASLGSTYRQVPRPLRLSLSLGSFGVATRTL